MTSPSWSDDDSDSNDAAMTSCRDVTAGRRAAKAPPLLQQWSSAVDAPSSPVNASSPTDLVELFDVYYVLPPPPPPHRGLPPSSSRRARDRHGEMTLNERRRPNANCLLDAVPPTPVCYERRAATLPASIVNEWSSLPTAGFVSIETTAYCNSAAEPMRRRDSYYGRPMK